MAMDGSASAQTAIERARNALEGSPEDANVSASNRGVTLEADGVVCRFDAAGRLTRLFDGDTVFQRGLNGTIVAKRWAESDPERESVRFRQTHRLAESTTDDLLEVAYRFAAVVLETTGLPGPRFEAEGPAETVPEEPALASVRRVLECSPTDLRRHADGFSSIYSPVSVLPPDGYGTVVLQPVLGCPYDCSFCTLYRDRDVTVRTPDAFESHTRAVRDYLGHGVHSRRGVFLGDADPLAAPHETVREYLRTIERELPGRHAEGVSAFCTARTAARHPRADLERLAERGLERVHVGVESGHERVLELLEKPQTPELVRNGVSNLKKAGLSVGAIVLAGAGGRRLAEEHATATIDLVASLDLDTRDVVYVSPLEVDPDSRYSCLAATHDLGAMTDVEVVLEAARLRDRVTRVTDARVAQYHVGEFVYG